MGRSCRSPRGREDKVNAAHRWRSVHLGCAGSGATCSHGKPSSCQQVSEEPQAQRAAVRIKLGDPYEVLRTQIGGHLVNPLSAAPWLGLGLSGVWLPAGRGWFQVTDV